MKIEIKNLSKSFGDNVVLDDISFKISEGENFVVFGRSGTGKSVLLKCIVGLLKPDSGEVLIDGNNILNYSSKEMNKIRKQMGFVFQGSALYDSMTVKENLDFPLIRNFKFPASERETKIKTVLEKVDLLDAIDKMPAELSGGMRKRIGLARAIITEPQLILYDEPTTGLDPITSKEISNLIVKLQQDLNVTAVVVTHDLSCAHIIANYAIVLKDGRIRYEGDLDKLSSSEDNFIKEFFDNQYLSIKNGSNNG